MFNVHSCEADDLKDCTVVERGATFTVGSSVDDMNCMHRSEQADGGESTYCRLLAVHREQSASPSESLTTKRYFALCM